MITLFGIKNKAHNSCLIEKISIRNFLTNTMSYRIVYRMKVTAIIADELIYDVKEHTHCSTVTEAITTALRDWIDLYNIKELNKKIAQTPINITRGKQIRETNRSK